MYSTPSPSSRVRTVSTIFLIASGGSGSGNLRLSGSQTRATAVRNWWLLQISPYWSFGSSRDRGAPRSWPTAEPMQSMGPRMNSESSSVFKMCILLGPSRMLLCKVKPDTSGSPNCRCHFQLYEPGTTISLLSRSRSAPRSFRNSVKTPVIGLMLWP